jgi:hypothetical protein
MDARLYIGYLAEGGLSRMYVVILWCFIALDWP